MSSPLSTTTIALDLANLGLHAEGDLKNAIEDAASLTAQLKAGLLTTSEYQELISDLKTEQLVNIETDELTVKEDLITLLDTVINVKGMIAQL